MHTATRAGERARDLPLLTRRGPPKGRFSKEGSRVAGVTRNANPETPSRSRFDCEGVLRRILGSPRCATSFSRAKAHRHLSVVCKWRARARPCAWVVKARKLGRRAPSVPTASSCGCVVHHATHEYFAVDSPPSICSGLTVSPGKRGRSMIHSPSPGSSTPSTAPLESNWSQLGACGRAERLNDCDLDEMVPSLLADALAEPMASPPRSASEAMCAPDASHKCRTALEPREAISLPAAATRTAPEP
eukprot:3700899-Pleurochrysis_carterae.AAC.1